MTVLSSPDAVREERCYTRWSRDSDYCETRFPITLQR